MWNMLRIRTALSVVVIASLALPSLPLAGPGPMASIHGKIFSSALASAAGSAPPIAGALVRATDIASGQVYESYMVLRGCLESALYGFFVAKNEDAKKIWMERHENEQALKLMKNSFQMRAIFSLLNKTDEKVYRAIQDLYDRTIDYGAHPNPNGVLGNLRINENEQDIQFQMSYLTNDPLQIQLALRTTAQIGIGALMLFRFVYPERFTITGLHDELALLAKDL